MDLPSSVLHHFTIDVEEYFQVSALEPYVRREHWPSLESRVRASMDTLLSLMEEHGVRSTCFVLGWVAERHPQLVREIADAGHEVASHGWDHRRVTELTPDEFREQARRSKGELEAITGRPVLGYRAPSFSIVSGREWALDILLEEGYEYDSSLFPVRRPGYGYAAGQRDPHWIERASGRLAEIPPVTLRRARMNLPAAGGAYLRLLPSALVQAAVRESQRRGVPATLYIHPWELDEQQPRFAVNLPTRMRHYGGLRRTAPRLRRLFSEFAFQPIAATMESAFGVASSRSEP